MTTLQRLMTLYWCLLPVELVFTWLDVSRQRAVPGTGRRVAATRRELVAVPAVIVQYVVAFAVALVLVARLRRLDQADQVLGVICSALLLLTAWLDCGRIADAWRDRRIAAPASPPVPVDLGRRADRPAVEAAPPPRR